MVIILGILAIMLFPSDSMKEFRAHSNGVSEYKWVEATECDTGLKKSGYSFAPAGRVVLKQVNEDGTVGRVCIE